MKITKALLADMRQQCMSSENCYKQCQYSRQVSSAKKICSSIQQALFKAKHPLRSAMPYVWSEQDIQEIYKTLLDPVEKLIEQVKEAEDED